MQPTTTQLLSRQQRSTTYRRQVKRDTTTTRSRQQLHSHLRRIRRQFHNTQLQNTNRQLSTRTHRSRGLQDRRKAHQETTRNGATNRPSNGNTITQRNKFRLTYNIQRSNHSRKPTTRHVHPIRHTLHKVCIHKQRPSRGPRRFLQHKPATRHIQRLLPRHTEHTHRLQLHIQRRRHTIHRREQRARSCRRGNNSRRLPHVHKVRIRPRTCKKLAYSRRSTGSSKATSPGPPHRIYSSPSRDDSAHYPT